MDSATRNAAPRLLAPAIALAAGGLALAACTGSSADPGPDAGSFPRADAGGGNGGTSPDADGVEPADAGDVRADAAPDGAYVLSGATQTMARRGGDGGDEYTIACPNGSVAVGISGRAGGLVRNRVQQLQLVCRALEPDGSLADSVSESDSTGGDGGDPFDETCSAGEAIAGLRGRAGSEIDAIGIECAPVREWVDEGAGLREIGEAHGGGGGDPFRDVCSRGYFVDQLDGRSGTRVDALEASCSEVVDSSAPAGTYAIGSETDTLPPRGGDGGDPFDIGCRPDELATGIIGRADNKVDRLELVCSKLEGDGSLTEFGTSEPVGGTGGDEFREDCPEGEAIAGLSGRAASDIDAVRLHCAQVAGWVDDGTGLHPWGLTYGGGGGDAFDDACAAGMLVRGLRGRAGSRIDAVEAECIRVE
jgi:hypothetical protein